MVIIEFNFDSGRERLREVFPFHPTENLHKTCHSERAARNVLRRQFDATGKTEVLVPSFTANELRVVDSSLPARNDG